MFKTLSITTKVFTYLFYFLILLAENAVNTPPSNIIPSTAKKNVLKLGTLV